MFRCFKYRLYPTKAQCTRLGAALGTCRVLYNSLLHWRNHDFALHGRSVSRCRQQAALPGWKKAHAELRLVHSQVLQDVVQRVDRAFEDYFRRMAAGEKEWGHPRPKDDGYDSFTFTQSGYALADGCLELSKIGPVKIRLRRPPVGRMKTCTIRRVGRKWFACLACESPPEPLPGAGAEIGIDVGLEKFAALSDAQFIPNPRFFRAEGRSLANVQRRAGRCAQGSRRRRRAGRAVTRVHERIRNRRHDFVHQTARRIVGRFGVICVEALWVRNMSARPAPKPAGESGAFLPNGAGAKSGLNKSIADAAWTPFRGVLAQKAERAGRRYVEVNPAWTSQTCRGCGLLVPKPLSERRHVCPCCLLSLDRDTNAALNILTLGRQTSPACP